MSLDPQIGTSGGGLYPASTQSQALLPLGNNKIEAVPALPPWREYASAAKQGEGLPYYDDFSQTVGVLNGARLPTGQTWALTGAGAASTVISDGQMVALANVYAYFDPGENFSRIDGAFSYRRRSSGSNNPDSTDLTLIVDSAYQSLATMLHLRISPQAYILEKRLSGGSFTIVASGTFTLAENGVYSIGMERVSATVVRLWLPDGSIRDVTDVDFALITWRYPCWQIAFTPNSWEGRWAAATIGSQTQRGMLSAAGAANAAAVAWLIGAGLSRRKRTQLALIGASNWYRIATCEVLYTFQMAGKVLISSFDGTRSGMAELDVKTLFNTASPSLVERFSHRYNGSPITQVRLSTDTAGLNAYLDVFKANATDATVDLDFFGLFTPFLNPVAGAVVGPTGSVTVVLT